MSEGIDSKELRYAKSLMDRGEKAKAKRIITDIIENSKDNNAVAEAMYCQVLSKFASDARDTFEKLKAYYPNSKYVSRLESVLAEREAEIVRITARDGTFVAYATGVVYDKNTVLEWFAGPDRDTTWDKARSWVNNLTGSGGDWRMPTREELKTLYQKGAGTCNMTRLLKTTGRYVWSGETEGSSEAWIFTFNGVTSGLDGYSVRSFSDGRRGFAVRSRRR